MQPEQASADPVVATAPARRQGVTVEHVGGEAVLHDADGGQAHVVNATAARLWELCDGTRDVDALATELAADYGLTAEDVRDDVTDLLGSFRALRLLA